MTRPNKANGPQSRAPRNRGGGAKNLTVNNFSICFSNVRGLRGNFVSVESFLARNSPDVFALCETNLNPGISSSDFGVEGYLPLIRKDSPKHMHGLAVYVRSNLPVARAFAFESTSLSYLCLRMSLLTSTSFLFFVYRSPSTQDCSVLDDISLQMDKILMSCPSAKFCIMGDFNAHHDTWLNSAATDLAGIKTHNFAITESLTQVVDFMTRIPDNPAHASSRLDLCFVSDPGDVFSLVPQPPLGTSDHVILQLRLKNSTLISKESPFHRTSYNYKDGDLDSFRDFLRDVPWNDVFLLPANECAVEIAEWIRLGIDEFIPHRRFQVKPHAAPWFSPECSAAIATRNHHFHRYRRHPNVNNRRLHRKARNNCGRIFRIARTRYMESTKSKISQQKLGSKDF